jgi:hypothetical protein
MKIDGTEYQNEDDPEGDYQAFEVDGEQKSLVFGLYAQLKAHKDHFSNMQNRYRSLASTWILAAFVGIGYLFSRHKIDLPFNTSIAVVILCVLATIGISLLWHLDIVVYQKLWFGTIIEMSRLEKKNKWLLKVNNEILKSHASKEYRFFQSYFYIGCNMILLVMACAISAIMGYPNFYILGASVVVGMLVIVYLPKLMLKFSGETEAFTSESFQDEDEM